VGASAITLSHSAHADFPIDNLIDDRAGTLFKFAATQEDPYIGIDLGSGFVTGLVRLIIPANHNIEKVQVYQDDDAGFPSPYSLSALHTATPGTQIDLSLSEPTSARHILVRFWNTSTTQHFLSQLVLTKIETLTVGPDLANSADGYRANVTRLIQNTGLMPSILHGPQQRVMEYSYAPIEGDDLTAMEALIATVGMDKPFWVDPASFSATPAADDPPIWMKFDDMPESRHTVLVPMSNAESKAFSLRLIESLD
jgi:hypothetical protein